MITVNTVWQPPVPPAPPRITVGEVYCKSNCAFLNSALAVAKGNGYEPTGEFRPAREGEPWLMSVYGCGISVSLTSTGNTNPRIILRKITRKQVVFTATGEVRRVCSGEYFRTPQGDFSGWAHIASSAIDYPIFTREDREV